MHSDRDARIRRVCIYCGSAMGRRPEYAAAAVAFARAVAGRGWGVVYGGASVGIMGAVADAALEAGAEVTGVIPRRLFRQEVAHPGLTRLIEVDTMHERKARMAELGDAFVALPGGLGTLEELFEILTWTQIGLHASPCGVLDVGGYFSHLLAFLEHTVEEGFVARQNLDHLVVDTDPERLLDALVARDGVPDPARRWTTAGGDEYVVRPRTERP